MSADVTLVHIASAGHSGSTLLDLLVANHSAVSSAGEMNRLTLYPADRMCACGQTVAVCPYWSRVLAELSARRGSPLRWEDCHTDLVPQTPVLSFDVAGGGPFVDGERPSAALRQRLADGGIRISDSAKLTRGGTRDFKWRLVDEAARQTLVLRPSNGRVDVYSPLTGWKSPVRMLPDPVELALAMGNMRALRMLAGVSRYAAEYLAIAHNSWRVAEAMSAVDGATHVVDSSKSPVRMRLLQLVRPERMRVLNLVRDGRAVAASAMRRHGMTATMAARVWKRDNQNIAVMTRHVPARFRHDIKYEALCDHPARELRRICDFLGLDGQEGLASLWQRQVHNIPGNPMLFNRGRTTVSHDERWRTELTAEDVQAFERTAGPMNRALGYTG